MTRLSIWIRVKITRRERGGRPNIQIIDFTFQQNELEGNREPVKILREELERVTHFKYLGTSIEEEGGMETEITKRVGAVCRNGKKWNFGVLCNRRIPWAETWATTKKQEKRIEVNETRMLRWSDTQRQDEERTHPWNNESGAGFQRRLNWYGHVMRRDEEHKRKQDGKMRSNET